MVIINESDININIDLKHNIRNICIFDHASKDTVSLKDILASAAGILARADGTEELLQASETALYYEMSMRSLNSYEGKIQGNRFLVNILDPPQYADPQIEFSASICIADGAILALDCTEGLTINAASFLRQALYESITPVLCLDLLDDSHLLESKGADVDSLWDEGEEIYCKLSSIIEDANATVEKYQNKLLPDATFHPAKGNVAFLYRPGRWGFSLDQLAKYWAPRVGVTASEMLERLWGDHFYDTQKKEWTRKHTGSETCARGFVVFCFRSILSVMGKCLEGDMDHLFSRGIIGMNAGVKKLKGNALLKHAMQTWLPAGSALMEMVILKVPSVVTAQKYRVEHLYSGPLNDSYAEAIRNCDSKGPLMLFISKVVRDDKTDKLVAFGRIFSGALERGMKVDVMGPAAFFKNKGFESATLLIGVTLKVVGRIGCGHVIALVGIDEHVSVNCTIIKQKMLQPFPIRAISFAIVTGTEIGDVRLKETVGAKGGKNWCLPYSVYDTLYMHQREGVKWLWLLRCKGSGGGILADDMGLGKTRQVSAFLYGMMNSDIISRVIIIAPTSVVDHWGPELLKVGLPSDKFIEIKKKAHLASLAKISKEGGICLTTFDVVRNHQDKILNSIGEVDYVFVDEGHRIKNLKIRTSASILSIKSAHRIIITGTPVQNNLMEFYALMKFCNPDLLGSEEEFKNKYVLHFDRGKYVNSNPDSICTSKQMSKCLKEIIDPFVLRRTKSILKETGRLKSQKYEVTVWLTINSIQEKLFKSLYNDHILKEQGTALEASKIAKQICMHPHLIFSNDDPSGGVAQRFKGNLMNCLKTFDRSEKFDNLPSSRLDFILHFLPNLLENGHRILIFSKSPRMLELLEYALGSITDVIRMDGTTVGTTRTKLVKDFQGKNGPSIFLMTTKVGGFGITLTAATRVLIIDPSDNPSDDNQAVDRAYRIGQNKDVVVYRLIMSGTIEEHVYKEQILKGESSHAILEEKQSQRQISKRLGNVLRVPRQGYHVSETHDKLVRLHPNGNKFPRSLKEELKALRSHPSVYKYFNHSALYSGIDGSSVPFDATVPVDNDALKTAPVGNEKALKTMTKTVDSYVAKRLFANGTEELTRIKRASWTMIELSDKYDGNHNMAITGDSMQVQKAMDLLQDFVDKVSSEMQFIVYVPKKCTGLIIGANGETIKTLRKETHAHFEVKSADKVRKDLKDKSAVIIRGNSDEIQAAKTMILQKLKEKGIPYQVEHGPLP